MRKVGARVKVHGRVRGIRYAHTEEVVDDDELMEDPSHCQRGERSSCEVQQTRVGEGQSSANINY